LSEPCAMYLCKRLAVLSLDEVDVESLPSHSLDGAAVAAANGANVGEHLPLRRMFSTSVLGSLLRKDVGTSSYVSNSP